MSPSPRHCIAAAALVAAAADPGAAPSRVAAPIVSLSAAPARLRLIAGSPQRLVLHNDGAVQLRVLARPASFAFDLYGDAEVSPRSDPPRSARAWLVVRPRTLVLSPHRKALLRIAARPARRAAAGDHHALVLLSALPPRHSRVSVRTRIGVLVLVRVPGRVTRRLAIGRVWPLRSARGRRLVVTAINRGNVAERLARGQLAIAFYRGSRMVARARGPARDLLPHTRTLLLVPLRRSLRGRLTAVVRIAAQAGSTAEPADPPLPEARKALTLRL